VVEGDLKGDRRLVLQHRMHRGAPLHEQTKNLVLAHVERLWGHEVDLDEIEADA
jgi:stage V sporulation protein R